MFFDKIYLDNFLFMQKKKSSLGKIIVNTRLVLPSVYISSKIANADGLKQRLASCDLLATLAFCLVLYGSWD